MTEPTNGTSNTTPISQATRRALGAGLQRSFLDLTGLGLPVPIVIEKRTWNMHRASRIPDPADQRGGFHATNMATRAV